MAMELLKFVHDDKWSGTFLALCTRWMKGRSLTQHLLLMALAPLPFLLAGDDERFQTEVMRLAPAPKHDPKQLGRPGTE